MNEDAKSRQSASLSDYLAAERTLLAWIRTGLALMGFGFVVARFGLFLQQIEFVQRQKFAPTYGLSLWFGTGLIAAGVLVSLASAWHHARLVRALARGEPPPVRPSAQAIGIAVFLALVGLAMMIYLVSIRQSEHANSGPSEGKSMASILDNGIESTLSHHSVDQTVEKLEAMLRAKGVALFALVDHSGEAAKAGMQMRPTKLLIFGNPKAGTPLMLAAPSSAIDLPLKILVWEGGESKVWISFNSPEYLRNRHNIPPELMPNIAVVKVLAVQAGE